MAYSFTVTVNPNLSDEESKILREKVCSIDGVEMIQQNGTELGELMVAEMEDQRWMQLMDKMLSVMHLYGCKSEPEPKPASEPTPPGTQEPEISDTDRAMAYLFESLKGGPMRESYIWLDAAKVDPPLTVRSILDANTALKVRGCGLEGSGLHPIWAWELP